jgi:hypothetical protein
MIDGAVAAAPKNPMPLAALMSYLGFRKRFGEALAAFERAPEQALAAPIVAAERGKLLAMLGREAEARQVIAEARTRWGDAPTLMEVWRALDRRR